MNQDTGIDDGYEENPWDDEDGENLRIIEDFLPSPEAFAKFKTYIVSDDRPVLAEDLEVIERLAIEKNVTPDAFIAGILHDFAMGRLVRREN